MIDRDPHSKAHHKECSQPGVGTEEDKVPMIAVANAVVQPRTVMVHLVNTSGGDESRVSELDKANLS